MGIEIWQGGESGKEGEEHSLRSDDFLVPETSKGTRRPRKDTYLVPGLKDDGDLRPSGRSISRSQSSVFDLDYLLVPVRDVKV